MLTLIHRTRLNEPNILQRRHKFIPAVKVFWSMPCSHTLYFGAGVLSWRTLVKSQISYPRITLELIQTSHGAGNAPLGTWLSFWHGPTRHIYKRSWCTLWLSKYAGPWHDLDCTVVRHI